MSIMLYFIAVIAVMCVILRMMVLRKNKDIISEFNQHQSDLRFEIDRNLKQMQLRSEGLNRYDFLKYNLEESLVVQVEISCNLDVIPG